MKSLIRRELELISCLSLSEYKARVVNSFEGEIKYMRPVVLVVESDFRVRNLVYDVAGENYEVLTAKR